MMVCNNLIDSLQPMTQGNTSSGPTAFSKVKKKKKNILYSLLLSN